MLLGWTVYTSRVAGPGTQLTANVIEPVAPEGTSASRGLVPVTVQFTATPESATL